MQKLKFKKRRKKGRKTPQNHKRPNIETEVYKRNRKCDLKKKNSQKLK